MTDKRPDRPTPDPDRIVPGSRQSGRATEPGRRDRSRQGPSGQEGANVHAPPDSHGRHGGNR